MPPDTKLTVAVMECKAQFVAEEDLIPLLTILPHVTPYVTLCVGVKRGRTAGQRERRFTACRRFLMVGWSTNVHVSGRPQLPPDGAGRGSSGL